MRNKLEVSVGTYEDFVNYVNSNEHAAELLNHIETLSASDVKKRHEQWAKYIEYCMGLYDRVVKPDEGALYVLYDTSINASWAIEGLYGSIPQQCRTDSSKLALYDSLTRQTQREQTYAGLELDGTEQYLAHAGSASREYPMAASQRLTIHRFGMLRTGEVLAVSGPPGTGKTTLLQSIVADLIVYHALQTKDKMPPLIVATSTNNQAVTNVIDAFAKEVKQDEGLSVFRRWIPDVVLPGKEAANASVNEGEGEVAAPLRGLGVYSPSSMKAQTALEKGYLTDDKKRKGNASLYNLTYARDYRAKAGQLLSLEASAYLGKGLFGKGLKCEGEKDAAKICKKILKRLEEVDDLRRELIKQAKQGTPASTRKAEEIIFKLTGYGAVDAKYRPIPAESIGNLAKLDAAIDTTVRPLEFWLAIHFYEAYWLSIEQPSEQTLKKLGSYNANLRQYQLLSMIAPLNVMTLFRVPSQFEFGDKHYFGGIDLLIVDEAGQVDTPVGAAAFALAKRAVVVGDVHQLAPVWGLDPEGDSQRARTYMDMGERDNFQEVWLRLKGLGLTASENSSLMAAAQSACPWTFANPDEDDSEELDELDMILKANFADLEEAKEPSPTGGIFLSEHRRCADNIIGYCNDLLYEGRLEPLRGSEQSAPIGLPTMGYCPVNGRSTTSGTSRKNPKEAEAIARWITAMLPSLWDACNQAAKEKAQAAGREPSEVDPRKVVGVVTPFASQAREVRAKLRWCGQNGRLTVGTTEVNLAKDITVGTAHSLQGAECPIVLFSLTYGERDTPTFVNGNPNLMNVAVSRAKDAFIVFGDEKTFSRETGNSVLGLLRERCFSHRVSMPEQTETTRPPIDRSGKAFMNADGNPAPAGAAPQGALSLTRAIKEARARGALPESLGTSVQQLNTALVEAGLLRLETDGGRHYVPTEAGASLGIATQVGKDGGSWPVYTPDALDRVAEALVSLNANRRRQE